MELNKDGAAAVIMAAWPRVASVSVKDLWVDSEGVANVRAEWEIDGAVMEHNLRMGFVKDKIVIL